MRQYKKVVVSSVTKIGLAMICVLQIPIVTYLCIMMLIAMIGGIIMEREIRLWLWRRDRMQKTRSFISHLQLWPDVDIWE